MNKRLRSITFVVFSLMFFSVSGLFAQDSTYLEPEFPPSLQAGPFPFGTEEVRGDAPVDITDPNEVIHEYTAYKGTVVVDGDLTDSTWAAIPWTLLEFNYDWPTEEEGSLWATDWAPINWWDWYDMTAWFKMIHDDDNIYVALLRYDDDISYDPSTAEDDVNIWQNDAYQIIIDTRPPGDFSVESPGAEVGACIVDSLEVYHFWNTKYQNPATQLELAEGDCKSGLNSTDGKAIHGSIVDGDGYFIQKMEMAFVKFDIMTDGDVGMLSVCALDRDSDINESVNQWAQGLFIKTTEEYGSVLWEADAVPTSSVESRFRAVPESYVLQQNYPNPFNPTTAISYSLKKQEHVTLKVYTITGQEVKTLVNQVQKMGHHTVNFNASNLTSGIYFYQLRAGAKTLTQKMTLMK